MIRWVNPYAISAIVAIFIALMRSPRKWSWEIDLALLRSMHHCFQRREDTALLSRFVALLEMLIRAFEESTADSASLPPLRNEFAGNQLRSSTQTATTSHDHSVELPSHTPSPSVLLSEFTSPFGSTGAGFPAWQSFWQPVELMEFSTVASGADGCENDGCIIDNFSIWEYNRTCINYRLIFI
jgi:hypothetical protein